MSLRLFKRFIVYHPVWFLYKNLALHPFLALRAGDKKENTNPGKISNRGQAMGVLVLRRIIGPISRIRPIGPMIAFCFFSSRRNGRRRGIIFYFSRARQKLPGFLRLVPVDPVYDAHVEIRLLLEHGLFFLV